MVGSTRLFRQWLRHQKISFDTSFLIPLLEEKQKEEGTISRLVRLTEKKSVVLITSTITLLEILVHPYRQRDTSAVADYYGYLTRLPLVRLVPVNAEIADRAARLRSEYGLKTADAIELATGIAERATLFLTRDRGFRKYREQNEIEIGIL